jgi:succinate-acetate transporter protein
MSTESGVATEQVPERAGAAAVADPTIADPGPLGLAAFAATTFMLSVFNAQLIKPASLALVFLPFALFYGGIAQLLAGMWEFKKANTFGALAFTSYGAFWLTDWYLRTSIAPKLPLLEAHKAVGLFLLTWTIFTAYMFVATFRINGALVAVFGFLLVTFALLTYGQWGQHVSIVKLGGWFGIITALLAWYTSFAGLLTQTWGRVVLPVFPLAPGAKAK